MKKYVVILLLTAIFAGCKKDSSSTSNNEYFFKYTVNGKNGGSSGILSSINSSSNQTYAAMGTSTGILVAGKSSDCNTNGSAPCYIATLSLESLSVGTHSFNTRGNTLWINENQLSSTEKTYWISTTDGIGGGTVTLTEVGKVGGTVSGTFSGKANVEDYYGNVSEVTISGSFRLLRTS